jgi:hypothetical protein
MTGSEKKKERTMASYGYAILTVAYMLSAIGCGVLWWSYLGH